MSSDMAKLIELDIVCKWWHSVPAQSASSLSALEIINFQLQFDALLDHSVCAYLQEGNVDREEDERQ